jgi:hypothetical protein
VCDDDDDDDEEKEEEDDDDDKTFLFENIRLICFSIG